ncbi:unnamed protein product [Urochloa decumbens]|uniref:Reticulon-like protein n=1 Tax=Urochloa decumbens TaxID=240449 RepID=A0ABC9DGJ5_9POAL
MEMEVDREPCPNPMPPAGEVAITAGNATSSPPQPPQPSPSPVSTSGSDDALLTLPISQPNGTTVGTRRSKRARSVPTGEAVGSAASARRKRHGSREPRAGAMPAAAVAASPGERNVRRVGRRVKREETGNEGVVEGEEAAWKVRRRKSATAMAEASKRLVVVAKREKDSSLALVPHRPTNCAYVGANNEGQNGWKVISEMVADLVMWKHVDRSAFWFGSGSMLFISSSFSRGMNFSPISVCCHFGVVILGLAFFTDSVFQRQRAPVRQFQLADEDVLHAAQAVLPIANTLISMTQLVFSGEPSTTLKVLPLLLFGAKFGHLLTIQRLLATGFFSCFTLPKLYSCYSSQVHIKGKCFKDQILNAWKSCPRKKLVMTVAVTTFWNLISLKTRIVAAFFCMVTLRYYYQYFKMNSSSQLEMHASVGEEESVVIED